MEEEKQGLTDIILDKKSGNSNNKKIVLAVATLGIILIIVVMLMSTLTSDGTDNLPQAVLPPKQKVIPEPTIEEEALFEEIDVIQEKPENDELDNIAQKLKQESLEEDINEPIEPEIEEIKPTIKEVKPTIKKETIKKIVTKKETKKIKSHSGYYIQVGSFSKYAPNKRFLKSITNRHYSYIYHKIDRNGRTLNKVLVGPFSTEKEAKKARKDIRKNIEAGAFLVKL